MGKKFGKLFCMKISVSQRSSRIIFGKFNLVDNYFGIFRALLRIKSRTGENCELFSM